MSTMQMADDALDELVGRNPRFHRGAYVFILAALQWVLDALDHPRHVSGGELARGVRSLALTRFGPLARTVLEYWGIHTTEDVGTVVFALVESGILTKQEEDSLEDFAGVFDFEEAFEREYPWGAGAS